MTINILSCWGYIREDNGQYHCHNGAHLLLGEAFSFCTSRLTHYPFSPCSILQTVSM